MQKVCLSRFHLGQFLPQCPDITMIDEAGQVGQFRTYAGQIRVPFPRRLLRRRNTIQILKSRRPLQVS